MEIIRFCPIKLLFIGIIQLQHHQWSQIHKWTQFRSFLLVWHCDSGSLISSSNLLRESTKLHCFLTPQLLRSFHNLLSLFLVHSFISCQSCYSEPNLFVVPKEDIKRSQNENLRLQLTSLYIFFSLEKKRKLNLF